jgi:hypothetical protein
MSAVQPQSLGRNSRISTASTSPGSAPLTKTGPLTGLTWSKSSLTTSSEAESALNCSSEASRTLNSTTSPGSTSSAGSMPLSHT